MIKHIVVYKLKDNSPKSRKELVDKFLSMKGKIPVLKSITAGSDLIGSERSFDVALICEFDTLADLETYRNHPVHVPVMNYVKSIIEKSHSVDYEF